ncbi:TetR/AcrR family transcriptional regulator [Acidobacterium sp. S8]|uniref:TetR/AcrR family transcriptional regulator n=1 Tax=Acidobacterium sp. S8 TaxID=1641854 RepID=UPI00131CCB12|nr:TetR/AcrR family transcriptional regulator [Acidobacterium sp. S8]
MAKATTNRKKVLTDFRRAEILAAAMTVFGKKGFEAARMDDVAQQAGIAKGTLYLYFQSKRDIYTSAVQHAGAHLQTLSAQCVRKGSNLQEKLEGFIAARLEFWGENRDLHRMLLTVGREAAHHKQTLALQRASMDALSQIFSEAAVAGEIPEQPFEQVAWAALDIIRGANERRFFGVTKAEPHVEIGTLVQLVLKTVRA